MFAFERQKKVVFPLDLSALTPRTMAGCCSVRALVSSLSRMGGEVIEETYEGHRSERVFDLLFRSAELMQLLQGHRTWFVRS